MSIMSGSKTYLFIAIPFVFYFLLQLIIYREWSVFVNDFARIVENEYQEKENIIYFFDGSCLNLEFDDSACLE